MLHVHSPQSSNSERMALSFPFALEVQSDIDAFNAENMTEILELPGGFSRFSTKSQPCDRQQVDSLNHLLDPRSTKHSHSVP